MLCRKTLLALMLAMTCLGASDAFAQDAKDDDSDSLLPTAEEGAEPKDEPTADEPESDAAASARMKRGRRMEFDARLIRGERASGAVFLFQRATRPLPSMVKRRTSYLDDTVQDVLGETAARRFRDEREKSEAERNQAVKTESKDSSAARPEPKADPAPTEVRGAVEAKVAGEEEKASEDDQKAKKAKKKPKKKRSKSRKKKK